MAQRVVVQKTDDIDGSKAEGTVSFAYDGTNYEIDLSKANTKAFEKALAVYIGHARKVRAPRGRVAGSRRSGAKHDLAAVRAWAADNGFNVAPRGRVAADVLQAYEAAH